MNYVIFDLEWNQPPFAEAAVFEPLYLSGEIIQIGAVKLNDAFEVVDELRLYIRPQYYTKLHKQISALTHIRDKDLQEQGLPFPEAYEVFLNWCGEEHSFMTWSMSDMPMLIDNMLLHGIDCSKLPDCYDIQRIFSREIMRNSARCSLDHALEILNLKGDQAHDALHDARNTAKICSYLDLDQYLEEYAARAFALQPHHTVYPNIHTMLQDETLLTFPCPYCGAEIRCQTWVSQDPYTYINYGYCPDEEDEFLLQLHVYKGQPGSYRVHRLFYSMSDDLWEIYQDRLGQQKGS